jgi:hypothetical protein
MKKWVKYLLVALLGLTLVGGTAVVYAQQGETPPAPRVGDEPPPLDVPRLGEHPPPSNPRPPRALLGEVTAVYETGFSLLTRGEETVEVNVHSGTKIWLVETQSEGSLDDIQVGDGVRVEGCRCGEASVGASRIIVGPDGDEVHGRVTSVDGTTIQLEGAEGTATVHTDAETDFRLGREEASLEDVTEGVFLAAFGEIQADGSLAADLVIVRPDMPAAPVRNVRGEVTAVSATGLTMLVQPRRDADGGAVSLRVNVSEETKVWLVEDERQGSLADVEVSDQVVVRGTRAEESAEGAPVMDARHIAIGPDGDEVHGRVVAVEGATLTLENREGQATVRTDGETSFRKGREPAALEDVTEGTVIVAFGETQPDGSLDADQVHIQRGAPAGPGAGPEDERGGPPPAGPGSSPTPKARRSEEQA